MIRQSEEIRLRYRYRDLVLKRRVKISLESARRLIGPDCAYHLYPLLPRAKKKKQSNSSVPGKEK